MNIRNRIKKLEQGQKPPGFVVIALDEGETEEQASQRFFSDGSIKPKVIIYANEQDKRL